MTRATMGFLALMAAYAVGCGNTTTGGSGGTGAAATEALPCDVESVLKTSCQSCHGATPSFGAPMSLTSYADLQKPAVTDKSKKVFELVGQRIHDDVHPMPQPPNARLTTAELSTMDSWIAAGAPAGTQTAACNTGGGGSGGAPPTLSCTPDIHIAPTSAWSMPSDQSDVYACYGFDVVAGDRKYITGFAPRIDNTKIVHHALLYQSDTPVDGTPTACSGSVSISGRKLIYGWAPGGTSFEMPPEAGFPMDATTHYYLQVHYNNINGLVGETDQSGFDLCSTTETRPNDADMVAFGTISITLPPNTTTSRDCTYQWPAAAGDVHAIAAFPHMHQLGTSISTRQNPASANVDLGTNAPWEFKNQPFMPISATLHPGDTIETRCDWNNTTPNTVNFGETTEDEMCFSFTMYYPRATSFKAWIQPSIKAQCK